MASPLVTARDLSGLLGPITVLDVRYQTGGPDGRTAYEAGHIPGAVYVDLDTELAGPPAAPGEPGGRHPLPGTAVFEAAMRAAGGPASAVSRSTYTAPGMWPAS